MLYAKFLSIRRFYRTDILSTAILSSHLGNDACASRCEPHSSRNLCSCRNALGRNYLEEDRQILLARCALGYSGHSWIYTSRSGTFAWRRWCPCVRLHWIRHQLRASRRNHYSFSNRNQYVSMFMISIALLTFSKSPMSQQQIKP